MVQKNVIYSIADEVLQAILQTDVYSQSYFTRTEQEKEVRRHYDEMCEQFKKTLSPEQQKTFFGMCDLSTSIETAELEKMLLYGMQVQESLRAMIEHPAEVLSFYLSKAQPAYTE